MIHSTCLRFTLSLVCILHCWHSDFLALSSVVALGANIICNKIPGLAPRQRRLCRRRPEAMSRIGEGVALGTKECEHQFQKMRWNCSLINKSPYLFTLHFPTASKEAAFYSAITTAGITYKVTSSCSQGNMSTCGCDRSKKDGKISHSGWQWGGCSADIRYGLKIARKFMDSREISEDSRALVNKHNNRAGRKAVKKNIRTECKCHGYSGTCTVKTCWTSLPHFSKIGNFLKRKFNKAKLVISIKGSRARRPKFLQLQKSKRPHKKPRRSDLVYLEKSPNYCDNDLRSGSRGTSGRYCNLTSMSTDGCDLLCCGRGYNTHQYERKWQCNCKFNWCCHVICKTCRERTETYTCK